MSLKLGRVRPSRISDRDELNKYIDNLDHNESPGHILMSY